MIFYEISKKLLTTFSFLFFTPYISTQRKKYILIVIQIFLTMKRSLLSLAILSALLEKSHSLSPTPSLIVSSGRQPTSWCLDYGCYNRRLSFIFNKNNIQSTRQLNVALMAIPSPQKTATTTVEPVSFIQTELRMAAMKLHTREQAPKEGVATSAPQKRYTPTRNDYLSFLVDSQHVFQTMEDIVNERDELVLLRNTGLERAIPLEIDIQFMISEYKLEKPNVGQYGKNYATLLRNINSIPEFMCHYYNFYFAHTAGGRMIGKQMSALLLDKKTLEFYKVNTL
jgi:hypothetical protein